MSKAPNIAAPARWPFGGRRLQFNLDWITRPVFGITLAVVAIAATFYTTSFAVILAALSVAAAREWHRIVERNGTTREAWVTYASLVSALALSALRPQAFAPWTVLAVAMLIVFISTSLRGGRAAWHAAGVLYVGVPALTLLSLRSLAPHGALVIVGLFLIVWATDTVALICGNLIGGPRLAPVLSPNKTWSGTVGGMAAAAGVEALYVGTLGGSALRAAIYGACVAVVAHGGDLFESWVKRTFEIKDSGGLIPGHGGVLDRIDSTLAAAGAIGIAVFVWGLDPLFGGHPWIR